TGGALPPTSPAGLSVAPPVAMPWQQEGGPWQWPPQAVGAQFIAPQSIAPSEPNRPPVGAQFIAPSKPTYHQGHRLFFYGVALIALPLQFLILILLNTPPKPGAASPAILGVLLGAGINLLALAAIGFVAVTRSHTIRKYFYRSLIVALIAPVLGGFFISFGVVVRNNDLYLPIVTYLVLLLSNIYTIRQLGRVD